MKFLVFDCETRNNPAEVGWKNYAEHGISFACAYLSWEDEYRLYTEDDMDLLLVDMAIAEVISGFNIINFDIPLVKATCARTGVRLLDDGWAQLEAKIYDPMQDICATLGVKIPKGWNLDNVAKSNLTICKNGDGAHAPKLFKEGKWGRLGTYVLRDVRVETHLFRHCVENHKLGNTFIQAGKTVSIDLAGSKALVERFAAMAAA